MAAPAAMRTAAVSRLSLVASSPFRPARSLATKPSGANIALGRDGEDGANGGDGLGGGLYIAGGTASVLDTAIHHNRAFGGDDGGNGGNGFGGGVFVVAGTVLVSASDISDNQALGGFGDGAGTDGLGIGGGVYNLGTFVRDAATVIRHNRASDTIDD
jgi:hypothetical protein